VKALQQIASETPGLAVVIVHHLRKSGAESDAFDKLSGTLGLSGAADTVLILDRSGQGTTLYGRGRDIEEIESAVEFDRATCRWKVLGAADDIRRSDERTRILNVLKDGPLSPTEISDATEMENNSVRQLLWKMTTAGETIKHGRGKYAAANWQLKMPPVPVH
jgi:hypothetical protein